jgi:hypothetical protein
MVIGAEGGPGVEGGGEAVAVVLGASAGVFEVGDEVREVGEGGGFGGLGTGQGEVVDGGKNLDWRLWAWYDLGVTRPGLGCVYHPITRFLPPV